MKSRRLICCRRGSEQGTVSGRASYVRFGSKADICNEKGHVRSAPNSDRESGHVPMVMSALTPKADVCGIRDVRFGPIADTSIEVIRPYAATWRIITLKSSCVRK